MTDGCPDVQKEQVAAAYMEAALAAFPQATSASQLRGALESILYALPASSMMSVLVVKQLSCALHAALKKAKPATMQPLSEAWILLQLLPNALLLVSFEVRCNMAAGCAFVTKSTSEVECLPLRGGPCSAYCNDVIGRIA